MLDSNGRLYFEQTQEELPNIKTSEDLWPVETIARDF